MRKKISLLLALAFTLSIIGCGGSEADVNNIVNNTSVSESGQLEETPGTQESAAVEIGAVDLDLTALSRTMIYSEVYNMIYKPKDYIGKTVRMRGEFVIYTNQDQSMYFPALIIEDSGGCCSESIEFVLAGDNNTPENYPEPEKEITVVGRFETYEEDGYRFCHLVDAVIE